MRQITRYCFCLLIVSTVLPVFDATSTAAAKQPNILLVMADDMGWTDLGAFGSEIRTPQLDELARLGVKFTDFHVSVSCSPTRPMLLSGTDNHLAGLGNMGEMLAPVQRGKPGYEGYLNDRVISLAEVFRTAGYHTYMAGKWHLGHDPEQYPSARGFERSLSMLYGGASYWDDKFGMLAVHEEVAKYVMDGKELETLPRDFYATRSYADFLIGSIRGNRSDGKPFLAYLAFTAPHDPLHVPEPWLSKNRGKYDAGYEILKEKRAGNAKRLGLIPDSAGMPARYQSVKAWHTLSKDRQALEARAMEVYAGMVENMDYHFGRVVDFLKDIGEYENTVIVFLSDNGPNPWYSDDYPGNRGSKFMAQFDNGIDNIGNPMSHYAYGIGWASASAGPLDLFKMTVGEGGIRSPLIISGPGVKGGRSISAFSYVTDIMPTLLEVAGLEHPKTFRGRQLEPMSGRSIVAVLSGKNSNVYQDDDFVGGEMQNGKWMRQGHFKAIAVAPPFGTGKWALYDVVNDPGETRDLAGQKKDTLNRLILAWERYARKVGVVLTE